MILIWLVLFKSIGFDKGVNNRHRRRVKVFKKRIKLKTKQNELFFRFVRKLPGLYFIFHFRNETFISKLLYKYKMSFISERDGIHSEKIEIDYSPKKMRITDPYQQWSHLFHYWLLIISFIQKSNQTIASKFAEKLHINSICYIFETKKKLNDKIYYWVILFYTVFTPNTSTSFRLLEKYENRVFSFVFFLLFLKFLFATRNLISNVFITIFIVSSEQ